MSNGTTILLPVASDQQFMPLTNDNSYFQIVLYAAQAFVALPWLSQAQQLICSTEVSSTFLPDHYVRSIHKVETIRKNQPTSLGLSVALTDWMPALSDKTLRVAITLVAIRDKPFGKLTDILGELDLASALSLVAPQIVAGMKVASIAGKMLGTILEEGADKHVLKLTADLPVHSMQSGYWAVIAPDVPNDIPTALRLRPDGKLDDPRGVFSERNTFAILAISARERRGEEAARTTAWWNLLQDGMAQLEQLDEFSTNQERNDKRLLWLETVRRAKRIAHADHSFLLSEIEEIIKRYTSKALNLLKDSPRVGVHVPISGTVPFESATYNALDPELQELLGVRDELELQAAVAAYEQALARSAAADSAGQHP